MAPIGSSMKALGVKVTTPPTTSEPEYREERTVKRRTYGENPMNTPVFPRYSLVGAIRVET